MYFLNKRRQRSGKHLALATALCSTLALVPAVVMAQQQAGEISGRITAGENASGIAGAIVRIDELNIQTVTERDGRFQFRSVAPGSYRMVVDYVGAPTTERMVTVSSGAATRENITLQAFGDMQEIIVYGQVAQTRGAINQKRSADVVKDVVTADSIGLFPDQNVAEAARRVAGVSVDLDQGEGRFIVIRGSDPNLNAVSVNGVRIPSSSSDAREIGMDVVPAELLSEIEIIKTVTPDMDGDAIGGTVEIKTFSAFDREGQFITGTVEGSYNDLVDKLSPKVSAAYSDIFEVNGGEDKLGIAISGNWFKRKFGSENVENGDGWSTTEMGGSEFFFPEGLEQRDYTITRERAGLAANVEYRIGTTTDLYLRSIYSRFNDSEVRVANVFEIDDGDFVAIDETSGLVEGDYVYEKDLKDRKQPQTIFSVNLGGESRLDRWTLDYSAGYSSAKETEREAVNALFEGNLPNDLQVGYRLGRDHRRPEIISSDRAALDDPANFALDEVEWGNAVTKDEEWAFTLNSKYEFDMGQIPAFVKFGGKIRLREKFSDVDAIVYDGFPDDPTLATGDFSRTDVEYKLGQLGAMPNAKAFRQYVESSRGSFDVNDEDTLLASEAEDFRISEDIYAGYLMGQADFNNLRVVAGLRMEHTRFAAEGTELSIDDDNDTLALNEVTARNRYTDWLPSVNARLSVTDDIVARAAFTKTLARPNFADAAPINERELADGELEGAFGNPELDPYSAKNFDLSLEFYPGKLAIISVAGFYKEISNYIVTADVAGLPGRFENFDQALMPINGGDATLKGIEFGYQQQLAFLPAPFDRLLVGANYTYAKGEADLPLGNREISLPRQSKHVANFSLGWEDDALSLRAALSYRSSYLDAIEDPEDPAYDRYVDDHMQWDFTARYRLTPNFTLFGKLQNLNNRPFYAYYNNPRFNAQYETYGVTGSVGLTANF